MPEIRWRDAASATYEWQRLSEAPASNRGFVEACGYLFEKPEGHWAFRIDDEELTADPGQPGCWRWEPRFFAGEVTAELVRPDRGAAAVFLLDVSPSPNKIGRDIFAQMVRELWEADPALVIGAEPAAVAIGNLGAFERPWLAFARLRRYAPEFFRAMNGVRARPRRTLRERRDSVPLYQARRVDRHTAAALLGSPQAVLLADDALEFEPSSRLNVPLVEDTFDSAANRSVLALITALLRRARAVRDSLQQEIDHERDSDTRTSLSSRWPARRAFLDKLEADLKVVVRQPPFTSVRRAEMTAAGLTAIAADPTYARAWNRGWRALRHGVESGESVERLWMSPSWEIYERWCFLRLGQLLAQTFPDGNWRRHSDRWKGTLKGRAAELLLQPAFRSRPRETEGMWSISRERIPDIVLTIDKSPGTRFVVFDAKYRTSRANVLDAMESAHIYQDSLRIGQRRPEASLLLVPSGGGASWLEEPAFQAEHRVGIHPFSVDDTNGLPSIAGHIFDAVLSAPDFSRAGSPAAGV